ncbi:MAG: ATP synthase subunit I [Xanthomonadales bacterium]|nr:ATP synthase subunit I [Xanthomonadales bacterium]
MNEMLKLMFAPLAGAALGLLYFSGLWATVRRLRDSRRPAVLMLGSLLARLALALLGFYFIARFGGWAQLLLAALGFTGARLFALRRVQADSGQEEAQT